jgi:hypothetical protein
MTPHADAPADLTRTRCTRSYQLAIGHTMDDTNAWREKRTPLTGDVDVTVVYAAAHDAFTRDLHRLAGARGTPPHRQRWAARRCS